MAFVKLEMLVDVDAWALLINISSILLTLGLLLINVEESVCSVSFCLAKASPRPIDCAPFKLTITALVLDELLGKISNLLATPSPSVSITLLASLG